jgi:hypothetical protein
VHVGELFQGAVAVAERVQGEHQFAGLGPGDPGPVVDAADTQAADHEIAPPRIDRASASGPRSAPPRIG